MSVGRICQREVYFADPDETVLAAAQRMRDRNVGTLVVLNQTRKPLGLLTDRDLVTKVVAQKRAPAETAVAEVMTTDLKTVSEETSIEEALSLMRAGSFRRLPVVDIDGGLVGLLSLDDVLSLLAEEFTDIGQLLGKQTPRWK
jgi:CBS domain-containing protein